MSEEERRRKRAEYARKRYHKGKGKEDYRRWYERHKETKKKRDADYYARNRARILAQKREYYRRKKNIDRAPYLDKKQDKEETKEDTKEGKESEDSISNIASEKFQDYLMD